MRRILISTVLGLAALAPGAQAAEVRIVRPCVRDDDGRCFFLPHARYTAAPGETNDLVIEQTRNVFVFRDAAGIQAGDGCTAAADGAVACRADGAHVDVGDGDDLVRSAR